MGKMSLLQEIRECRQISHRSCDTHLQAIQKLLAHLKTKNTLHKNVKRGTSLQDLHMVWNETLRYLKYDVEQTRELLLWQNELLLEKCHKL